MSLLIPKDLPTQDELLHFASLYPELDPPVVLTNLLLLKLSRDLSLYCESYFSEFSLSEGRFTILALLYRAEQSVNSCELTPAELAESAGVSRATVSGLMRSLEADAYIRRKHRKDDRRMVSVCLTTEGRKLLESMLPAHFKRISKVYRSLDPEDLSTLRELLTKVYLEVQRVRNEER